MGVLFKIGYSLFKTPLGYYASRVWHQKSPHSLVTSDNEFRNNAIRVIPVPCFSDNYAYIVVYNGSCVLVDPADPRTMYAAIKELGVNVAGILTTHCHWDHSAGAASLVPQLKNDGLLDNSFRSVGCDIEFSGITGTYAGVTQCIAPNQTVEVGGLTFRAIHTPWHTKGHVMYLMNATSDSDQVGNALTGAQQDAAILFSGDALFVAGTGKYFEGTAAHVYDLEELPGSVVLYPGHEYALRNLQFTHAMEQTDAIHKQLQAVTERRSKKLACVPSTMAHEMQWNTFLRLKTLDGESAVWNKLGVVPHTSRKERIQAIARLRIERNQFS